MAGDHVTFIERPSREALRDLYRRSRALLNPGVEDFGMTMAEAQACGTSVIAQAAGGAQEIVVGNRTGVLYEEASPQALSTILREFEPQAFDPDDARSNAERFAPARFDEGVLRVVESALRGNRGNGRQASDESSMLLHTVAPTHSQGRVRETHRSGRRGLT
jgi:glycosyltransferase involved in cell wall biosynthesis